MEGVEERAWGKGDVNNAMFVWEGAKLTLFGDWSLGGRFTFSCSSVIWKMDKSPVSDGKPKSTESIRSIRLSDGEGSLRSILVMSA